MAAHAKNDGMQQALLPSQPSLHEHPHKLKHDYVAYAQRWWLLLLYSLSSGLSAFIWISAAPVQSILSDIFDASAIQVDLISISFFIMYLPASLLGLYCMERWGLKVTLTAGAALNALAVALKYAGTQLVTSGLVAPFTGFSLLLTGQFAASVGQPLIVNPVSRVAADWFGDGQRDLATTIGTQANVLGQVIANLLPPFVVHTSRDFALLQAVQMVPAVLVLGGMAFTTDRPPTPPSASAAASWHAGEASGGGGGGGGIEDGHPYPSALASMWRDCGALLRNGNFLLLLLGWSATTGIGWTLLTVEEQMLSPCGYSDVIAGYSGTALLGLGIITAMVAAPVMARTRAYALLQKGVMLGCLLATVAVLAVNRPGSPAAVISSWLLLGAGLQPLQPLTLEHAAEMTYPVPADVSSAMLQTGANLVATVQTFVVSPLLNLPASANCSSVVSPAALFIGAWMLIGALITLPIKAVYARTDATDDDDGAGLEDGIDDGAIR